MLTASLLDGLIDRIGWALLHSVWIGTAAAMVLAIVLRTAGRASASVRYAMCCLAMLGTVLAICVAVVRNEGSARSLVNVEAIAQPLTNRALTGGVSRPIALSLPTPGVSRVNVHRALPIVVGIWLCGVSVIAIWQMVAWTLLVRLRREANAAPTDWSDRIRTLAERMGIRRVALRISTRIDVPVVIGVLRPIVLVPVSILTELAPAQVQAILAHELAHIRRFDPLINLILVAMETLLFYHPAVWWISKQIRRERECACDDLAAEMCGGRTNYAQALASLELIRGPRLALSIRGSGARGELLARVQRLLLRDERRTAHSSVGTFVLLIVAIAVVAVGAANRLAARVVEPTSQSATATSQPTSGGVERLGLRREYDAGLARMQEASQQLAKVNLQIMQMEQTYGAGYKPLQQLKAIAAKFDEDYRTAKREVLAIERTAHENGIDLDQPARASVPHGPTTREASRVLRISIGVHDMYLNGKLADVETIRRAFNDVPADAKESTLVEVSIATPNVPAGQYFAWKSIIAGQVTQAGLPPISEVGVEGEPPDGEPLAGEYYMGGDIERAGVYSLTARKITLKQALISAGALDGEPTKLFITIIRSRGEEVTRPVESIRMSDLFDGTVEDLYLKPNDQIMVKKEKTPAASQPK